MKLVTVAQMKAIEAASDAAGHSYDAMMDRAGAAVARVVQSHLGSVSGKRVLILAGSGNNGGDGLVAAVQLRAAGAEAACYLLRSRDDARVADAQAAGAFVAAMPDDRGLRVLRRFSLGADAIVDALFGTGARRPLPPDARHLLNTVRADLAARRDASSELVRPLQPERAAPPLVVAVDGPSGMDFDTGELDDAALAADVSVTFAYPKIGHTRFPAAQACGELVVADIGTYPALADDVTLELADARLVRPLLPGRPADAHKGTFGRVMIVAGSRLYSGAPALAASAAYRAGAGLVTVAAPESVLPSIAAHLAEVTYLPLPDTDGVVSQDAVPTVLDGSADYRAMLLGPGLTREPQAAAFVDRLFGADESTRRAAGRAALTPLVVDADALNILADMDSWHRRLPELSVLTPHPGEMARLTGLSGEEIAADRIGVAGRFASAWGQVVVLKGAFTVVAARDGRIVVLPFANPALATAGSGDVLAGAIAGLCAQGLDSYAAAVCGAYLHGLSGELARREIGLSGVLAGDLSARLPAARRLLDARR